MAYQKQIYQDGVTEYTEELYEHMDDGIFGAYPVQLIAISDTAPSTCAKDDKYYNTSTKKIYTATGTNTWGTNGETPLEDTAYWLISENGSYAWDGTDLVSIGGGKAEVVISDEEPEEGKLWVDTAEIQTIAGRDRLVNVSNEVDEDYRVNFLKSINLFDKSTLIQKDMTNSVADNKRITSRQLLYLKAGTYTFKTNLNTSTYSYGLSTNSSNPMPSNDYTNIYTSGYTTNLTTTFTITSQQEGYFMLTIRKIDNSALALSDVSGFKYSLARGDTATDNDYFAPSIVVNQDEIYNKDNIDKYSFGEIRIGTWIDGKPLYRKVVDFGALPNNAAKQYSLSGMNIDFIKEVKGTAYTSQKNGFNIPYPVSGATTHVTIYWDANNISVITSNDRSAYSVYLILEYTKTTD